MSNAGFKNIGLGIETFSDRLLHKPSVNKLGVNSSDYNIVIDSMLKLGIVPQMFIIIGIPESTISDVMLSIKKSASYVMKGADMAVISTMRAYPGSPVLLNNKYRVSTTPWDNKEKNIRIKILDYFIPSNQTIAAIINKIDPAVIEEQNKLKLVMNWDEGVIVSKSLVAMTQFIAVSKLLEQFDIANDLYKKLYKSLGFSRVQIEKFISLEGHNF